MNRKILIGFALVVMVLIMGVFGFIFRFKNNKCGDGICQNITCTAIGCPRAESIGSCPRDCAKKATDNLKACTEEAKICPDGSSVVRSGPNCEFAPCSEEIENSICKNLCGNGSCQEIVCMGTGCPCAETAASCSQDCAKNPSENIVGGDKDEHGCIGSAGYSWCEAKQKCLRVWEEKCLETSCRKYAPPAPGWCSDGTIIPPVKNSDGCYGPPGCEK